MLQRPPESLAIWRDGEAARLRCEAQCPKKSSCAHACKLQKAIETRAGDKREESMKLVSLLLNITIILSDVLWSREEKKWSLYLREEKFNLWWPRNEESHILNGYWSWEKKLENTCQRNLRKYIREEKWLSINFSHMKKRMTSSLFHF